jgi:hypothetical protein
MTTSYLDIGQAAGDGYMTIPGMIIFLPLRLKIIL